MDGKLDLADAAALVGVADDRDLCIAEMAGGLVGADPLRLPDVSERSSREAPRTPFRTSGVRAGFKFACTASLQCGDRAHTETGRLASCRRFSGF